MNDGEVKRLLEGARSLRDRALLETGYATGMRVSEVTRLLLTDVDSQRMMIRVEQGKGRKDRYVMLSPSLLETLREYWRASKPREFLFPGMERKALCVSAAQKAFDKARQQAGIRKPVSFHTLRGLSLDGKSWISSKPTYFLPVLKLSEVFRGKLLQAFELALKQGRLRMSEVAGRLLLRRAAAQDFVVYSKPPMAGPEQVLRYLGRYTHRIAIGNQRILAHEKGEVTFSYKDRQDGGIKKTKILPGTEFTRRFLLHVVPRGFVRVRHFGLLANGVKVHRLAQARTLLGTPAPPQASPQSASLRLRGRRDQQHAVRLPFQGHVRPSRVRGASPKTKNPALVPLPLPA